MQIILRTYVKWHRETKKLPKDTRYSLGIKISSLFTDLIEHTSLAQFSIEKHKVFYIDKAIAKNDVLKCMFYTLFELGSISEKTLAEFVIALEEIGKMLYGWKKKYENK